MNSREQDTGAPGRYARLVREYAPVALALLFGLVLSFSMRHMMRTQAAVVAKYDFGEEAKRCIGNIERGLNTNIDLIRWLGATFSATPEFNQRQFRDLTSALSADQTPAMELQWWPRVPSGDRKAFEESARTGGAPAFAIREWNADGTLVFAGERAEYFPLLYTRSAGVGQALGGFDLGSDPAVRRYLDLAAGKGEIFFVSDAPYLRAFSGGGAVLAICPVYEKNQPADSPEERRAHLQGFAAGLIRLDALSDTALAGMSQLEMDLHIYDFFAEPGRQFLHYRPGLSQTQAKPYLLEEQAQRLETLGYVGGITLGTTRRWLIACTPSPGYVIGIQSWSPLLGLALGLAFTAVVAYHFYANIRLRRAAERLVLRRTAQLKRTNERLVHEVAERKHFEEERDGLLELLEASNASLQQVNERLETSNRDLQDFALVASHDLKEPLRKVRALARSLRSKLAGRLDAGCAEYLDLMDGALDRMHDLITNLLQISRISTHGQPFEPVDLGQIVADVISDLAVRIEETGGTIEVGELPTVEADPMQMRQFVQNILDNSLKFHRNGLPPKISVACATHYPEAPDTAAGTRPAACCTIVFEDNGTGFASEDADRAFTLFQRLHNGGRVEGNGVGLAVCRKIVERHGGTVAVQSEVGKGSTFTMTLPLAHNGA